MQQARCKYVCYMYVKIMFFSQYKVCIQNAYMHNYVTCMKLVCHILNSYVSKLTGYHLNEATNVSVSQYMFFYPEFFNKKNFFLKNRENIRVHVLLSGSSSNCHKSLQRHALLCGTPEKYKACTTKWNWTRPTYFEGRGVRSTLRTPPIRPLS